MKDLPPKGGRGPKYAELYELLVRETPDWIEVSETEYNALKSVRSRHLYPDVRCSVRTVEGKRTFFARVPDR